MAGRKQPTPLPRLATRPSRTFARNRTPIPHEMGNHDSDESRSRRTWRPAAFGSTRSRSRCRRTGYAPSASLWRGRLCRYRADYTLQRQPGGPRGRVPDRGRTGARNRRSGTSLSGRRGRSLPAGGRRGRDMEGRHDAGRKPFVATDRERTRRARSCFPELDTFPGSPARRVGRSGPGGLVGCNPLGDPGDLHKHVFNAGPNHRLLRPARGAGPLRQVDAKHSDCGYRHPCHFPGGITADIATAPFAPAGNSSWNSSPRPVPWA